MAWLLNCNGLAGDKKLNFVKRKFKENQPFLDMLHNSFFGENFFLRAFGAKSSCVAIAYKNFVGASRGKKKEGCECVEVVFFCSYKD